MRKAWFREEDKKKKFLEAIRGGASNLQACQVAGWSFATVEGWIDGDDAIRLEVETARSFAPAVAASKDPPKVARDEKTGVDKWKRLRDEAAKLAPGLAGILLYVDGLLATKGHPPMSAWWRQTLCDFYESGKRWCLLLVGRGGGKSTTLERAALVESIFEHRKAPPGQTWSWLFLSVLKSDARKRLDEIGALLDGIGVQYTRTAPDGVQTLTFEDANGNQVSLMSIAASIAATSGPTSIGCTCDEEEKWADDDTGANPAKEVLKSIRQTFRTRAGVRAYRCSSKFDNTNLHFKDIEAGDTAAHFIARLGPVGLPRALDGFEVAARFEEGMGRDANATRLRDYARTLTEQTTAIPAWVANPSLDIEQSRIDEEDFDTWMREVASHGDGGTVVGNMFPEGSLERTFVVPRIVSTDYDGRYAAIDTGASENPSTLAIVERHLRSVRLGTTTERRYQWQPFALEEWHPYGDGPLDLQGFVLPDMARRIVEARCVPAWWTDGYAHFAIEHVARLFGLQTIYVSTSTAYRDHYAPLRVALSQHPCPVSLVEMPSVVNAMRNLTGDRRAAFPSVEKVIRQLRQTKRETKGDTHRVVLQKVGTEHADLSVALVRALAHAGIGTMPPNPKASTFRGFDDRYSSARRGTFTR